MIVRDVVLRNDYPPLTDLRVLAPISAPQGGRLSPPTLWRKFVTSRERVFLEILRRP
jgi:hypothetical protein